MIYRRIMSDFKLKDIWTEKHTKAFLNLKAEMTSEPVLRGPKWDGSPFIITTDGSKDAFGAVSDGHGSPAGKNLPTRTRTRRIPYPFVRVWDSRAHGRGFEGSRGYTYRGGRRG